MAVSVDLRDVTAENWRACARLEVSTDQRDFVIPVTYSLCLCLYDGVWQPLAACESDQVAGFLTWTIDPDDGSCWFGSFIVDRLRQRRGYGTAMVQAFVGRQRDSLSCTSFATSYTRDNEAAQRLFASQGFAETGALEDGDIIARMTLDDP